MCDYCASKAHELTMLKAKTNALLNKIESLLSDANDSLAVEPVWIDIAQHRVGCARKDIEQFKRVVLALS